MLWVISGGLVLVNAAVWIVLLRLLWRERGEKWHWKIEASTYLSRARTWQAQAEAFEAAGKTQEEHVAAERGRADRLAEALQDSEDKREQLGDTFKIVENALIQCKERLAKANGENKMLKREFDELRKSSGAANTSAAIDARELANVMNYNGTAEGQVDLNDE